MTSSSTASTSSIETESSSETTSSISPLTFKPSPGYFVDYVLYRTYDSGIEEFHLWSTVFTVFGSVLCTVLNSYLIYCLVTVEDFKNLIFFPIGMQAAIDVIGPGISNIIYSCLAHLQLRDTISDYRLGTNYFEPSIDSIESSVTIFGKLGCLLTFFRSILNEFSTGYCVLASAFIRYCLICHPTRDILTVTRLRALSMVLVLVVLAFLAANIIDMSINYRMYSHDYEYDYHNTTVDRFIENCAQFTKRNNKQHFRLFLDICICLIIPAVPTAFFYSQIIKSLLQRDRDQERNRSLVMAMLLNCTAWLVCWVPYYVIMSFAVKFGYKKELASELSASDVLVDRIVIVRDYICLLYSHLNPLFFIILLKQFQEKVSDMLYMTFCSFNSGFGLQETNNKRKAGNLKQQLHGVKTNLGEKNFIPKSEYKKKFKKVSLIFTMLVLSLIFSTILIASQNSTGMTETKNHAVQNQFTLKAPKTSQNFNLLTLTNVMPTSFKDPRDVCGTSHGLFSFLFKRCYKWENHYEQKLNLTEQVRLCESNNFTLIYPRTLKESQFVFRYHLFMCGSHCAEEKTLSYEKWFKLRLGIVMTNSSDGWSVFRSADESWDIITRLNTRDDYNQSEWNYQAFDYEGNSRNKNLYAKLRTDKFTSSVCLKPHKEITACNHAEKLSRSVCFFDFSSFQSLKLIQSDQ